MLIKFSAVTLFPAVLKLCSDIATTKNGLFDTNTFVYMALDVISIVLVIGGIVVWPVFNSKFSDTPESLIKTWAFPVGATLTSFGYWESFVSEHSKIPTIRYLWLIKTKMNQRRYRLNDGSNKEESTSSRYVTYLFISAWKILIFFILFIVFSTTVNDISHTSQLFKVFKESMHGEGYKRLCKRLWCSACGTLY